MANNQANIKAVITADDRASSVLKGFGNKVDSIGHAAGAALKTAAIGIAAATAATAAFGVASVKAFAEAEDGIAQTNAVLKSTASVAGVTADEVDKLSKALQKTTKYSDEEVRSAENLLLTFTSITKDIFPDATKIVLDMSTALGQDLKSSSVQVGKALQDPILGVTALRRVGVNFSDAQKDVIKNLVDTGRKAEAQKLILKELQTEFGGSAEAAGKTFAGSLARLKNAFNDIQETIGVTIVRFLTPLIQKVADFVNRIDWEKVIKKAKDSLKSLWEAMKVIATGDFKGGIFGLEEDSPAVMALLKVHDVLVGIKNTGVAVWNGLKKAVDFLTPSIQALFNEVYRNLFPALQRFYEQVIKPLAPVIGAVLVAALWLAINALNVFSKAVSFVLDTASTLFTFFTQTLPAGFEAAINWIVQKVIWLKDNFWEVVGFIIGFFATLPFKLPLFIIEAFAKIVSFILSFKWSEIFAGIWWAMQGVWDKITQIVVKAWHYIHDLKWSDLLTGIAKGFANALIGIIEGALKGALKGLPGNIESKIHLPRFAKGTDFAPGGLAVVGERGPELVNLPRGSQVVPNDRIGSGSSTNINISVNAGVFMGSDVEARKAAQTILNHMKQLASSKNQTLQDYIGA